MRTIWQQECDLSMPIFPHCPAICLQHSRSATVSVTVGARQAISDGPAKITRASRKTPTLEADFNK